MRSRVTFSRFPISSSVMSRLKRTLSLAGTRALRENAWRRTHEAELAAYAGQWVVLEGETIVAHGTEPARLIEKAKGQGVQIPYIFYVEELTPDVVMMGL